MGSDGLEPYSARCGFARREGVPVRPDSYPDEGNAKPENRSLALLAPGADGAAHHFDKFLADGKPQTRAAELPRRGVVLLIKFFENSVDFIFGDADARVLDFEMKMLVAFKNFVAEREG